jgi:hypothetical protein
MHVFYACLSSVCVFSVCLSSLSVHIQRLSVINVCLSTMSDGFLYLSVFYVCLSSLSACLLQLSDIFVTLLCLPVFYVCLSFESVSLLCLRLLSLSVFCVCQSVSMSVCPPDFKSICLFTHPSVCPPACLPASPSISLCLPRTVYIATSYYNLLSQLTKASSISLLSFNAKDIKIQKKDFKNQQSKK